jgi:hypothetical protein
MAKEDGIYAMRFASQQILIDKLQQENKQLKEIINKVIDKLGKYAIVIRSNGEAYTICVDLLDILNEVSE